MGHGWVEGWALVLTLTADDLVDCCRLTHWRCAQSWMDCQLRMDWSSREYVVIVCGDATVPEVSTKWLTEPELTLLLTVLAVTVEWVVVGAVVVVVRVVVLVALMILLLDSTLCSQDVWLACKIIQNY